MRQPSKLDTRVRFSHIAPIFCDEMPITSGLGAPTSTLLSLLIYLDYTYGVGCQDEKGSEIHQLMIVA